MKRKTIASLIVIVVIASVAVFAGCVEKETPTSAPTLPAEQRKISSLIDDLRDVFRRDSAIESLVEIGEPAVEPLIQALKDEDSFVREGAAEALGKIGDKRAVEPLIHALNDEDWQVRWEAAEALDELGYEPKNDTEKAYYLIARKNWDELVKMGEPAVEPLIQALKDEDIFVREAAVEALGKIGDKRAVEPLIHVLDYARVRQDKVVTALEKIGWESRSLPTGTFLVKKISGGYGELTIENGLDWDAIIILSESYKPDLALISVYIQAGDTYTITGIEDGIYILYYALGKDWDSNSKKFRIKEEYARFEEEFEFETTGITYITYTTYTVTLYPVVGGTARTEYVSEEEFPKLS